MTRYGKTDPSAYQLRDLNRRVTKAEKALLRMKERQTHYKTRVADKLRAIQTKLSMFANEEE